MDAPFLFSYEDKNQHIAMKEYIYRVGTFHYNWHQDLEVLFLLKGKMEVLNNGVRTMLYPGDLIAINSQAGHATLEREPESIVLLFRMDPVYFSFLGDRYKKNLQFVLNSTLQPHKKGWFPVLRRAMVQMMLAMRQKEKTDVLDFFAGFYQFLHVLTAHFTQFYDKTADRENQQVRDKILQVTEYIDHHYTEKITLKETAERIGYSTSYLSQLFKQEIGINFYEYLTRKRIREATRELDRTSKKIVDIGNDNGFQNLKSFNMKFKEIFGLTPSQYREILKQVEVRDFENYHVKYISQENPAILPLLEKYLQEQTQEAAVPLAEMLPIPEEILLLAETMLKDITALKQEAGTLQKQLNAISQKSTRR